MKFLRGDAFQAAMEVLKIQVMLLTKRGDRVYLLHKKKVKAMIFK